MMQSETDTLHEVRREFLWRFSKYVLDDKDFEWVERHVASVRRLAVEPMFPMLRYVWNHLSVNLTKLEERMPGLAPIAGAVDQYCERHRDAHRRTLLAQDELFAALGTAGVWPLAIKGAAMRAVTPVSQAMGDVDVITRDLDETWAVIEVAEQLGYPLEKIKLRHVPSRVPGDVRYHGYANLYRCEGGVAYNQAHWDLGLVRTLDLHIGRFYGPGEGVLVTDLWRRARKLPIAGNEVLVPSLEDMFLVEVLHLVRHGTLSMGSLNRVCQLLADHELDLDYLRREIGANELLLMTHAVLQAIIDTFPHAAERAHRLRSGLAAPARAFRWAVDEVAATRRVERYGAGSAASVALQTAYVYGTAVRQSGRAAPADTAIIGFTRMFRHRRVYPRAHARWNDRRLGWLSSRQTAIMMTRLDRVRWTTARPEQHTGSAGRWMGRTTLVVDEGLPTQTVLTPVGAFSPSRYDGKITAGEQRACLERAEEVRTKLSDVDSSVDRVAD